MNGFERLQERLRAEGWYVGWNEPCCQTCAWGSLPYEHPEGPHKGEVIDLDRALFNHSQDCEVYVEGEECPVCEGEGYDLATDEDCEVCNGVGEIPDEPLLIEEYDTSVSGFICNSPTQQNSSYFCFGNEETLKAVLPIIEECGCTYTWSESISDRIEIAW